MLSGKKETGREAFTLIEMMVVIAIIGILIAGVFRLLSTTGENTKRAETMERLQRLENALSGFYAEYGSYPPVPKHGSPDPYVKENPNGSTSAATTLDYKNARRASRCQPVAFEFPTPKSLDDYIVTLSKGTYYAANQNPNSFPDEEIDWKECKLFRYGVLSFLLPRLEAIGGFKARDFDRFTDDNPDDTFFSKAQKQWSYYNEGYSEDKGTLEKQYQREMKACARWMPNFERTIFGGKTLMGINTAQIGADYLQLSRNPNADDADEPYTGSSGNAHKLALMTIKDGWGNDLFYYSAPPYQSYRIWSSGKDGKTFPPWISLENVKSADRETVNSWVKDDVARFDQ